MSFVEDRLSMFLQRRRLDLARPSCDVAQMDVKRTAKLSGLVVLLSLLVGFGSCAAYFLPSTEKVHLTGTEIKRKDAKDGTPLHDVRYIQAQTLSGESIIFANEDTRWGFPFYFKFNASDLSAEAANIAKATPEATILVTSYGVRSQVFDLYPNAVGLRQVAPTYVSVPIFNIVFCLALLTLLIVLWVSSRRQIARAQAWWGEKRKKA